MNVNDKVRLPKVSLAKIGLAKARIVTVLGDADRSDVGTLEPSFVGFSGTATGPFNYSCQTPAGAITVTVTPDSDGRFIEYVDTSEWTSTNAMFKNCTALTSLDVSHLNTSNVVNMAQMFYNCENLTSLNLSNLDTSKADTFAYMFQYCERITSLDLSGFNTSALISMNYMFENCYNLASLDLSRFDASRVKAWNYIFRSNKQPTLNHIKCTSAFRDWCLTDPIQRGLPTPFHDASYSGWEIVD